MRFLMPLRKITFNNIILRKGFILFNSELLVILSLKLLLPKKIMRYEAK